MAIAGSPLQAAQPIVEVDGTMAYHFRNFMVEVNAAIEGSELVATWGNINGTLSAQTDLQTAIDTAAGEAVWGGITGTLADQTDLQAAITAAGGDATWGGITGTLSDQTDLQAALDATQAAGNITSGTFADARIAESSVTQHQAALSVTESQVSDLDKYTQAEVDALLIYYAPTVRDEATDPYTLVLADANKVLRFTTVSAAVTIPTNASVAFAIGTEISIRQAGTGTLVLTTTSLTINGTVPTWAQHVEVKFRKVGTDTWDVV